MMINELQKKKIISWINTTLTQLCIPAIIKELKPISVSMSDGKTNESDIYEFKSNEFNTVPSIFKNVYITGKIIPNVTFKAIDGISYIDYDVSLNYKMKQYSFGENELYIGKMTCRFIKNSPDFFELINGLELR